ncbi:hypothetical protein OBBRIDRAFT_551740 [Obba rivulosa]|uniref:Uncharacterized protein n=1 Tax=Obba rivulosa TaxID=1052685 RepID=A0A8E2DLI0_9APHY|nr:hypothetical protein OBBRIDRAFT_551740 [Obba rivulosa]
MSTGQRPPALLSSNATPRRSTLPAHNTDSRLPYLCILYYVALLSEFSDFVTASLKISDLKMKPNPQMSKWTASERQRNNVTAVTYRFSKRVLASFSCFFMCKSSS